MTVARGIGFAFLSASLFGLSGCADKETGVERPAEQSTAHASKHDDAKMKGQPVACKMCYDEIKTVMQAHGKGTAWGTPRTIREHQCGDCNGTMRIYVEDGKAMFKCPHCAPDGVACDKCKPPKS